MLPNAGATSPLPDKPPRTGLPSWLGYAIAVSSTAFMTLLRLSLQDWLEQQSRFILFLPAVMLTAWYGGLGPALTALALGAGAGVYLFIAVPDRFHRPPQGDWIGLALYLMAGLMIALVTEMQRKAKRRAEANEQAAERARQEVAERHAEVESLNRQLRRAMMETYHRVKNNLQVIAALVGLQMEEGREMVPATELRRIEQHLRALAVINDLLTQQVRSEGEATTLSSKATLDKLLPVLASMVGERRLHWDVQSIPLTVKQGASLAVLINELISNAVKHSAGDIDLVLTAAGRVARLEVCDDGPGFPEGFDARVAAHTGLDLIESISRMDLRGQVTYQNRPEGGACVRINFPIESVVPEGTIGIVGAEEQLSPAR